MENAMDMVQVRQNGALVTMTRGQAIALGLVVIAVIAAAGYAGYRYGKSKDAEETSKAVSEAL